MVRKKKRSQRSIHDIIRIWTLRKIQMVRCKKLPRNLLGAGKHIKHFQGEPFTKRLNLQNAPVDIGPYIEVCMILT
ncbi:hypothetical protein TNIN_63011, partial [Trichonephila inaurata madagascariensis]